MTHSSSAQGQRRGLTQAQVSPPYRWVVLACGTLAFSTSYLVRWSHSGIAKYLQQDLHLDKTGLGVLGSAFFWVYALMQIPWGTLADRLGGRVVIAGGTILTGLSIGFFAMATDLRTGAISRAAVGIFSASVYVPMAAVCACWFTSQQRGLANSIYHGVGAGTGNLIALVVMPHIATHLKSGRTVFGYGSWRGSVMVVAMMILCAGTVCAVLLRSKPGAEQPSGSTAKKTEMYSKAAAQAVGDVRLWLMVIVFVSFTMSIRLVDNWVQVYAADLFIALRGLSLDQAVVSAATVVGGSSVAGRILGEPVVGKVSDAALRRGISRGWVMAASLASTAIAFALLTLRYPHPLFLGAVSFCIGALGNSAPIVNAAVSEAFGESVSGFAMGVVNTVGQLSGAFVLTISGWVGVRLSAEHGNLISEYIPIWWLGIASCTLGIVAGIAIGVMRTRDK